MALNWPQKVAVYMGGFIILGMLVYPPWKRKRVMVAKLGLVQYDAIDSKYSGLFAPPDARAVRDRKDLWEATTGIDVTRLLVQCLAVAVATGMAVFAGFELRKRQTGEGT